MYQNNVAVAIRVNSEPKREVNSNSRNCIKSAEVFMPCGQEYTIYINNKNNYRIYAKVSIDGMDISDPYSYIVQPNSDLEIKRFMIDGNLEIGKSFKTVDSSASQNPHNPQLGKVKIVVSKEAFDNVWTSASYTYTSPIWTDNTWKNTDNITYNTNGDYTIVSNNDDRWVNAVTHINYCSPVHGSSYVSVPIVSKELATEEGSVVNQKYSVDSTSASLIYLCEFEYSLKKIIMGSTKFCYNCGTELNSNWNYCSSCGRKVL